MDVMSDIHCFRETWRVCGIFSIYSVTIHNDYIADMSAIMKCRKCRCILLNQKETSVVDNHGNVLNQINNSVVYDCGGKILDVWYLQETEVPEWVTNSFDKAEWMKGKLSCPQCNARIGSFDFISGSKCSCTSHVLPPIHVVKSKIDLIVNK